VTTHLTDIINQLEREQTAIGKALIALREVAGLHNRPVTAGPNNDNMKRRRKLSAAARKKMSDAQKKRWASTRGDKSIPRKTA
jgi:hypothetical protein